MQIKRLRFVLAPLAVGGFIGSLGGTRETLSSFSQNRFLEYGLYNTVLSEASSLINRRVLETSALCYLVLAAWSIRKFLPRNSRRFYDTAAILEISGIYVYKSLRLQIRSGLRGMDAGAWLDALSGGAPQIAASVGILILGLYILGRMRKSRRATGGAPETGLRESFTALFSAVTDLARPVFAGAGKLSKVYTALFCLSLLLILAPNVLSGVFRLRNAAALRDKPNIVFVMVDTLRPDHLGCYGYKRDTSPNIDNLAAEGLRFEKVVSQAPWTSASVGSFMTGRYLRIALMGGPPKPPPAAPMLAEYLNDRGYSTAGVVANILAGKERGFDRGFEYFRQIKGDTGQVSSPWVTSTAIEQIRQLKNSRFFLFLLFMDPHSPYTLHKEHDFSPGYEGKYKLGAVSTNTIKDWSADDFEQLEALYDSEIAFTDEHIGKVIEELRSLDLYDDTMIVFLSDHGEALGEHGIIGHGLNLFDETIRVPLIIKLPGRKEGRVVKGTFSLVDLFPTIVSAIGVGQPAFKQNGTAISLSDSVTLREKPIYSSTDFGGKKTEALRSGSHKLIHDVDFGMKSLYDLDADPRELHDVISAGVSIAAEMNGQITLLGQAIDADMGIAWQDYTAAEPTEQEKKTLRSLGYLQ